MIDAELKEAFMDLIKSIDRNTEQWTEANAHLEELRDIMKINRIAEQLTELNEHMMEIRKFFIKILASKKTVENMEQ